LGFALEADRKFTLGLEHPQTMSVMLTLASNFTKTGGIRDAEDPVFQILEIQEKEVLDAANIKTQRGIKAPTLTPENERQEQRPERKYSSDGNHSKGSAREAIK